MNAGGTTAALWSALLLAFTTGVVVSPHCIAMCGGFVAAYSLPIAKGQAGTAGIKAALNARLLAAHLVYNSGRLTTYALIGGLMGLLGSFVEVSGRLLGVQGLASALAGAFMILLGLSLGRWIPRVRWLQPAWTGGLRRLAETGERLASRATGLGGYFSLGLLLGLMPCGPLYAMQISAAGTGSRSQGALTLLAFGLGTVPALFGIGLLSTILGRQLPHRVFKAAAVLVIVLGVITLLRGLAMLGLVPHVGLW